MSFPTCKSEFSYVTIQVTKVYLIVHITAKNNELLFKGMKAGVHEEFLGASTLR